MTVANLAPDAPDGHNPPMVQPDPAQVSRQRILLVTGMLGAGKTTVLRTLEDLGWEAVDNFPIRLLDNLLLTEPAEPSEKPGPLAIGFDSRTRAFDPERIMARVERMRQRTELNIETLFLDCSSAELERRYNETRRRHAHANDRPVSEAIAAERELLAPLQRWADRVINTTSYNTNALAQAIREQYGEIASTGPVVTVTSFGFARGMPPLADLVFDMRFLANPHWDENLRPLTGQDSQVADFIRRDPAFEEAFARIRDLLLFLLERYSAQGKTYVAIAFGCTGGKHRSVFMAEEISRALRATGFSPTVLHRNVASAIGIPAGERQD